MGGSGNHPQWNALNTHNDARPAPGSTGAYIRRPWRTLKSCACHANRSSADTTATQITAAQRRRPSDDRAIRPPREHQNTAPAMQITAAQTQLPHKSQRHSGADPSTTGQSDLLGNTKILCLPRKSAAQTQVPKSHAAQRRKPSDPRAAPASTGRTSDPPGEHQSTAPATQITAAQTQVPHKSQRHSGRRPSNARAAPASTGAYIR